jgi:hypothetical protein
MRQVMVRYRVKPEHAAENERLVRAVYDELRDAAPDDVQYATFRLDDGVTFVHVAFGNAGARLPELAAFRRFQEGIADRCDEPPVAATLSEVGSYRMMRAGDAVAAEGGSGA